MSEHQDPTAANSKPATGSSSAGVAPIENLLFCDVSHLLQHAKELRDEAGRSEKGRLLAIATTDLEKLKAFIGFCGL